MLVMLMFAPRLGKKVVLAVLGMITAVIAGLSAAIGLAPVWSRFISLDSIENSRWQIFSAAFDGAKIFQPLGAGPSSFPAVFPHFQPLDMLGFVNRAHNDYLELFFDTGWVLVVPVAVLIIHYFLRWVELVRGGVSGEFETLQAAAGLSIFLMFLHSLFDFNLHIPANMGYFAFLSGVFFHVHSQSQRESSRSVESRTEFRSEKIASFAVKKRKIPEENLVNPFSETPSNE
jgi:O-antigen ligase